MKSALTSTCPMLKQNSADASIRKTQVLAPSQWPSKHEKKMTNIKVQSTREVLTRGSY